MSHILIKEQLLVMTIGAFRVTGDLFSYDQDMANLLDTPGGRITLLRKEQNLTQTDIAERLGVAPGHMSQVEANKRGMSIQLACQLVAILNTSLDYIYGRTDNPLPISDDNDFQDRYITPEANAAADMIDKLPKHEREKLLQIIRLLVSQYEEQLQTRSVAVEQLKAALGQTRSMDPSVYSLVIEVLKTAAVSGN